MLSVTTTMKNTLMISALMLALGAASSASAAGKSHQSKPGADNPAANVVNQKADEPETQVLSDTLDYDDNTKTSTFAGNVILTRGLMRLTADKLVVSEDKQGTKHGTATSNSGMINILQERPEQYETVRARGQKGTYEGAGDVLHLTGNAVVVRYICGQAVDSVSGHEVVYNNKNSTYHALSSAKDQQGRRVRSIASPKARTDALINQCRAKYGNKPMPSEVEKLQKADSRNIPNPAMETQASERPAPERPKASAVSPATPGTKMP